MKIIVSRCYAGRPLRGDKEEIRVEPLFHSSLSEQRCDYFGESLMQQANACQIKNFNMVLTVHAAILTTF